MRGQYHLVGLMIRHPMSCFLSGDVSRPRVSRIGMMKASVFPLPVTASAATSFLARNRGMAAAWTNQR